MALEDQRQDGGDAPCRADAKENGGCDSAFADVKDTAIEEEYRYFDHGYSDCVCNEAGVDSLLVC